MKRKLIWTLCGLAVSGTYLAWAEYPSVTGLLGGSAEEAIDPDTGERWEVEYVDGDGRPLIRDVAPATEGLKEKAKQPSPAKTPPTASGAKQGGAKTSQSSWGSKPRRG